MSLVSSYKSPQLPNRERVTEGLPTISTDHANIHAGAAFSVSRKFTITAAASAYLEFVVPAGAYVHFKPTSIESDGPKITAELIEAPTITPGNNALTPRNRRRLGTPAVSGMVVRDNPTGVSGGTSLGVTYLGGGTGAGGNTVSGAIATNDNEWVLAPSTTYVIKLTNGGTGSADVNIQLFWYEEADA